ncbi:MAG: hypothetical protein SO101_08150, partial [Lachnospiraceae bacterium]|nr:hypothetical protein [Lachnospiraceae bacterium]
TWHICILQYCFLMEYSKIFHQCKLLLLTGWSTRHFFCNAGTNSFWINWKGNLTGCGLLDDPFEDLNIMPFHIAWSTISQKIEKILVTEECSYCARREICNVCPAKIKAETGSYEEIPYYICNMTEQIIKEADIFRQDN